MSVVYHPENTRSFRDMGGIKLYQSFQQYYPPAPNRRSFGVLVALDNALFTPETNSACTHKHENIEILTIPVFGALTHYDTTGYSGIVPENAIQLVSAGTGIEQTEYMSGTEEVDILQCWFLVKEKDIPPRYQMKLMDRQAMDGSLQLLVSPDGEADSLIINQDIWVCRGGFQEGENIIYRKRNSSNALYVFIVDGAGHCMDQELKYRDGLGIIGTEHISIRFTTKTDLIIIELPAL